MSPGPALLLIGHGSRSAAGVDEYWQFADVLRGEANGLEIGCGFIELPSPTSTPPSTRSSAAAPPRSVPSRSSSSAPAT